MDNDVSLTSSESEHEDVESAHSRHVDAPPSPPKTLASPFIRETRLAICILVCIVLGLFLIWNIATVSASVDVPRTDRSWADVVGFRFRDASGENTMVEYDEDDDNDQSLLAHARKTNLQFQKPRPGFV